MEQEQFRLGIDLGGTKVEGVVIRLTDHDPEVLARQRVSTEQEGGYEHILERITHLVQKLEAETNVHLPYFGIGTPGTLDPLSQLLKNSNTICLNGQPFKRDLEKMVGKEVRIANDANCFAIAETMLGVVRDEMPDARVVFGVIMGTGVGGGVVFDGKVWNGRQGIGGEWGHNFLDSSGGACYCGRFGCVETVISGTGLERFYFHRTGTKRKLADILKDVATSDAAQATQQHLHHFFGKAIASVVNLLDPDAIVLGGGVGNVQSLYTEGVAEVAKYIFNNRLETRFLRPKLGDSAGVFGAALL